MRIDFDEDSDIGFNSLLEMRSELVLEALINKYSFNSLLEMPFDMLGAIDRQVVEYWFQFSI